MSTYIVTNGNNSGAGSLREVITLVNADINPVTPDINFDLSVNFIFLQSALPIISRDVNIVGHLNKVIIRRNSFDQYRIIDINATGKNIRLENLKLENGSIINDTGCCIKSIGNLSVINSEITRCISATAISVIDATTITLTDTIIYNNRTQFDGIICRNSCSIDRCSIIDNFYPNQAIFTPTTIFLTVRDTTFARNSGRAIFNNDVCTAEIINSTFANNGQGILNIGNMNITSTTISGNGGSFEGNGITNIGTVNIGNTIVAGNNDVSAPDVSGIFNSLGNNLIGNTVGSTGFISPPDIINQNALLLPLGNYGGPTETMPPQFNSPAIRAGNVALIPPGVIYDQRGIGFPRQSGGNVDIGSIEVSVICYIGSSLITVKSIESGIISDIPVQNIHADKYLVYAIDINEFIPIRLNIVSGPYNEFILVNKDSLGDNVPSNDFYITSGHIVRIDRKSMKAREIPGCRKVKTELQKLYSICTDGAYYINVNNIQTLTWDYDKWINYTTGQGIAWDNQ
jgi:hypothetical protein